MGSDSKSVSVLKIKFDRSSMEKFEKMLNQIDVGIKDLLLLVFRQETESIIENGK